MSKSLFIFGGMEQEQYTNPEEAIEELFFYDYVDCVMADVSLSDLSDEEYETNEEQIHSVLLVCFNLNIRCYQATEIITNISKNFIK